MKIESEQQLEDNLIKILKSKGYKKIKISNEKDLLLNFKKQLEIFNKITFNEKEFENICNHLDKGNIFEKSKILRDRFVINRNKNENIYIKFFDGKNFSNNIFQVTNQVNVQGQKSNRYDVSILVNGIPLIHIELKKRDDKESQSLLNSVQRIIDILKENPQFGNPIEKRKIPKHYQKLGIKNLYRCELSNFRRLIYTLEGTKVEIFAIVLNIMDHKKYKYKALIHH